MFIHLLTQIGRCLNITLKSKIFYNSLTLYPHMHHIDMIRYKVQNQLFVGKMRILQSKEYRKSQNNFQVIVWSLILVGVSQTVVRYIHTMVHRHNILSLSRNLQIHLCFVDIPHLDSCNHFRELNYNLHIYPVNKLRKTYLKRKE